MLFQPLIWLLSIIAIFHIDACTLLTNLDPGQNASSQFGSIALSGLFSLRDNMEIQQKSSSFDIYLAQQRRFEKNKESQFNNNINIFLQYQTTCWRFRIWCFHIVLKSSWQFVFIFCIVIRALPTFFSNNTTLQLLSWHFLEVIKICWMNYTFLTNSYS